ncbi:STAS domain-containing protein [Mycolicibacterium wolinskyi]|uniref:STAS domain-containing protein n=1 Tax=Mycolicibacterium wolinskyi TaxID=59750 RepID=UPI0039179B72
MSTRSLDSVRILAVDGVLDSTTYRDLRNTIIKIALDEPRAVVIDITDLHIPAESALAVFTSARWHVSVWPDVPLALACGHPAGRAAVVRNGITRYVPVYAGVESALAALGGAGLDSPRRRAKAQLPALHSSVRRARTLVTEWMLAWSRAELIPVASVVVDVLVENVLEHTQSAPALVAESKADSVTIAVTDNCVAPAVRREDPYRGSESVSGLAVVAALARTWGSTPTSTGKTVWAVIGPENCI